MLITYWLDNPSMELGRETSQGITEVLFPDVNYNNHAITITKMFNGQTCCRWQVVSVIHPNNNEIQITLQARTTSEPEVFLSKTYKVKNNVIRMLQKGTLVEVEYGYIPSVKKNSGDTKSNKRYPDALQPGEMHKRRLAIVVKASPTRLQVVPITSLEPPAGDRTCFELDRSSLDKLTHYNDTSTRSFALCGMIESISLNRVLPPLAKPIKTTGRQAPQRSDGYPHKLSTIDIHAFDKALSVTIGLGDYQDIKSKNTELYRTNAELKASIDQLSSDLAIKDQSLAALQQEALTANALRNTLEVLYKQMYSTKDSNEVNAMIETEIAGWNSI